MTAHIWTTDTDLRVTAVLGDSLASLGLNPRRYVGMTLHELVNTEGQDVPPATAAHLQALQGQPGGYSLTVAGRLFDARVEPLRDGQGHIVGCIGLALDITERTSAEEAVRESEERFRCLVQNSSDIITILEVDGTIRYESFSIERLLGYKPDELNGKNAFALVHPDDLPNVLDRFSQVVETPGSTLSVEFRFRHARGEWCYLESTGTNLLEVPAVAGIVVNSRDITERKQAEQEHSLLAAIVESSDDAIISTTLDGIIGSWNPGAERLYGYSSHEAKGQHISILAPRGHCDHMPELLEIARRGERINQYEMARVRQDGKEIYVSLTLSPIKDGAGTITGVATIARDMTTRRELAITEERGWIARELHDSLAQVLGYVNTKAQAAEELLRRGQLERAATHLAQLAEAARAAYTDVSLNILGLRTSLGPPGSLLDSLRDYVERWQEQSRVPAELIVTPSEGDVFEVPPAAELQLVRILQEALANVRKHAGATRVRIRLGNNAGWIEAEVEDDGVGFQPTRLAPEPFPRFGLATMRERAEAVGGRLEIDSAPGRGTRVKVYLPADPTAVASAAGAHARPHR